MFHSNQKKLSTVTALIGRCADVRRLKEPMTNNLIWLCALYLSAYLVGLTPAVPVPCGLAITALVIVNIGFLFSGLGRDR
jgi:hypothetical protein